MHLPKLATLFAGLVERALGSGSGPSFGAVPRAPRQRLIVLDERTKVMRPRRWSRDGRRQLPAATARLVLCTHAPHGKAWPRRETPITRAWREA